MEAHPLDEGSVVDAELSFGRHPALVLNSTEEIEATGNVLVVPISANATISLPEDLIPVPSGLGMKKKCFVQCGAFEVLPKSKVAPRNRKAWGSFWVSVKEQTKAAMERTKKLL